MRPSNHLGRTGDRVEAAGPALAPVTASVAWRCRAIGDREMVALRFHGLASVTVGADVMRLSHYIHFRVEDPSFDQAGNGGVVHSRACGQASLE